MDDIWVTHIARVTQGKIGNTQRTGLHRNTDKTPNKESTDVKCLTSHIGVTCDTDKASNK